MNKNLKKIIAREGLIILGFIMVAFIVWWSGTHAEVLNLRPCKAGIDLATVKYFWWAGLLGYLVLIGYPVYLVIRFIIWAIKTLREK